MFTTTFFCPSFLHLQISIIMMGPATVIVTIWMQLGFDWCILMSYILAGLGFRLEMIGNPTAYINLPSTILGSGGPGTVQLMILNSWRQNLASSDLDWSSSVQTATGATGFAVSTSQPGKLCWHKHGNQAWLWEKLKQHTNHGPHKRLHQWSLFGGSSHLLSRL